MSLSERFARASDRFYDRMRSSKAQDVAETAPTGSLADLQGHQYCVLVTYKKSGEPMPSPLWFGTGNGKLYFQTGAGTAKVKLYRGGCAVVGRVAQGSLYDHGLATYEEGDSFQHGAAAGFIHVWSLPTKTWAAATQPDTVEV